MHSDCVYVALFRNMTTPLKYRSGEEIRRGDCVRFHGNVAKIELVAFDPSDPDPDVSWHVKEHGGGVMVLDPLVSGRTFIPSGLLLECEDLEFVSRVGTSGAATHD